MHDFRYSGSKLCCEGVAIEALARRFGTPGEFEALLQAGFDANTVTERGTTALMMAAAHMAPRPARAS